LKEASDVICCVVDAGLFLPVAHRLAKGFKKVYYHCPNFEGFPTINRCILGDGFDDIEMVEDLWSIKKDVDCFVFPDIQNSGLQLELESQGFPVWGSRRADSLEIYRQKFHRVLEKTGLPVPTFEVCKGWTELRDHLMEVEDKYIKISKYRGSLETTHWRSWSLDEGLLDVLAVRFGPAKELIPFLVFDAIETDLEIGSDTYTVDGKWPSLMLNGLEHKDKGYISAVTKKEDMPQPLLDVLEAFGPILGEYRCRNQWSTEVRVKDDVGYFTDPTPRGGIPSTPSQLALWTNFPKIVWAGANGELIDPIPAAKYSAECMITAKSSKEQWPAVELPEELREWTAFGNCCQIDGRLVFPADESHDNDIGWLIAIGDTMGELIDKLKENADFLPDGLDADTDSLVDLLKEAATAEENGIEFGSHPIPKPETALNL
jgi:hypothetical protein